MPPGGGTWPSGNEAEARSVEDDGMTKKAQIGWSIVLAVGFAGGLGLDGPERAAGLDAAWLIGPFPAVGRVSVQAGAHQSL